MMLLYNPCEPYIFLLVSFEFLWLPFYFVFFRVLKKDGMMGGALPLQLFLL